MKIIHNNKGKVKRFLYVDAKKKGWRYLYCAFPSEYYLGVSENMTRWRV